MTRSFFAVLFLLGVMAGAANAAEWIIRDSASPVDETADKLIAAVEKAGATVFARIDHAAGARSVGEEMAPMTMVMFGNPKIGTPIIKAAPRAGIDLPIRVLIWDEAGTTKIGYPDPVTLMERYDVEGMDSAFETMANALDKLTAAAANGE